MRLLNPLVMVVLLVSRAPVFAAGDVQLDATRAVASPDGKLRASVERLSTVRDAEPEAFSGRMIIRVTDATTKAIVKQRYVEASQVRLLEPPVWLNSGLCAFSYNIAKNARGMVYFEIASGKALQVELVSTARKMAASNKVEQELTSLDVTEHAVTVTRIQNITHQGGTAFPLRIKPLALDKPPPFGIEFVNELNSQLEQYRRLCASNGVKQIVAEQATESVSEDESKLAVLACADSKTALCIVPVSASNTSSTISLNLLEGVKLPCAEGTTEETEPVPQEHAATAQDFRYATSWKPDGTAVVEREVFDPNGENSSREPVFLVTPAGALQKVPPPEKPRKR